MSDYFVRQMVMDTGERLPVLCTGRTGQPVPEPLLYALTELRARGLASATIRNSMEAVMLLQLVLEARGIDLNDRLRAGRLLDSHEIDLVVNATSRPISSIRRHQPDDSYVSRDTAASRILYIHAYLVWRSQVELLRKDPKVKSYKAVQLHFQDSCAALKARGPCAMVRGGIGERQGLSDEAIKLVVGLIESSHESSPWNREHTRVRNSLILRWFYELGIRRGELLGIKTTDIDFQQNLVLIARRADSKDDPRRYPPNTKTKARLLPLSRDLADATYHYIMSSRRSLGGSLRHEFLFVADGGGAPLSLVGLSKVFAVMRRKRADLPCDLSPHVLRHTWNDRFSEAMDQANVPEEQEKKMRSTLMGWSESSGTAATYTRRYVQRKAAGAIKSMQAGLRFGRGQK